MDAVQDVSPMQRKLLSKRREVWRFQVKELGFGASEDLGCRVLGRIRVWEYILASTWGSGS